MRLLGLALVVVLGLSGCASAPGYPASVAAGLERRVMAVATDCADGHFTDALAKLGDLQAAAASAQADGDISADRQARISTAIDLVRQDLQARIAEAQRTALDGAISSLKEEQQKLAEQQKQAEQQQAELEKKAKEAEQQAVDEPAPAQPAPDEQNPPKDDTHGKSGKSDESGKPGKSGKSGKSGKD
jgi:hypothetical protein